MEGREQFLEVQTTWTYSMQWSMHMSQVEYDIDMTWRHGRHDAQLIWWREKLPLNMLPTGCFTVSVTSETPICGHSSGAGLGCIGAKDRSNQPNLTFLVLYLYWRTNFCPLIRVSVLPNLRLPNRAMSLCESPLCKLYIHAGIVEISPKAESPFLASESF